MERIDTSGCVRDFDTHFANGGKLQQEAAAMDNDERFVELTAPLEDAQMDDAPGNTPSNDDTPAPSPMPQQKPEPAAAVPVPSLAGKMVRASVYGLFDFCAFMVSSAKNRH
jgi:hypothetical protein